MHRKPHFVISKLLILGGNFRRWTPLWGGVFQSFEGMPLMAMLREYLFFFHFHLPLMTCVVLASNILPMWFLFCNWSESKGPTSYKENLWNHELKQNFFLDKFVTVTHSWLIEPLYYFLKETKTYQGIIKLKTVGLGFLCRLPHVALPS